MSATPRKLLIASSNPSFYKESEAEIGRHFEIQRASSADMCLFLAREWEPQICVIDADSEVSTVTQKLRLEFTYHSLGIVVSSGYPDPELEAKSFQNGADYFLQLSKDPLTLMLRLQTLIKRMSSNHQPESTILKLDGGFVGTKNHNFMNLEIFPQDFLVKRDNQVVSTSPTQFRLLLAFLTHPEQLLTRAWLKQAVWENTNISPRSIDAQISKLKKLFPEVDQNLANIYGRGYILTIPQKTAA